MISKPIKLTAFWLKFAVLTRKRLYDVENFAYKLVLMRLPSLGSHVTSGNRDSFVKQEGERWERGCFCEICRSDLSSILKINLILLL